MASIVVYGGHTVLLDDADVALVSQYAWHFNNGYVKHHYRVGKFCKALYLHRLLTDADLYQRVIHRNGNKLDYRRSNLQVVEKPKECSNVGCPDKPFYRGLCSIHYHRDYHKRVAERVMYRQAVGE